MIEFTVRDTESGREKSGRAKAILLLTGAEEPDESTLEQMEREGTDTVDGVLYFGAGSPASAMGDALANSALEKTARPMRSVIVSIENKMKEKDYETQFTLLVLHDLAAKIMEKCGVKAAGDDDVEK